MPRCSVWYLLCKSCAKIDLELLGVFMTAAPYARTESWLADVRTAVDRALLRALVGQNDTRSDPSWQAACKHVRDLSRRPAKRLRPAMLVTGMKLARKDSPVEAEVWTFAAGLELLHLFMLIHDDVADRAETRRGGPSLHMLLGGDRTASDLAIVVGDHLFARSLELMLEAQLPGAFRAARYLLGICRETAVGQFLDIRMSGLPLKETHLFAVEKVAMLKTAHYSFVGPLVAGGILADAPPEMLERLEPVGRHLGVAYQLRDDCVGLFGDERATGKPSASDFIESKKTYPVVSAYLRSSTAVRLEIDALYAGDRTDPSALARLRAIVEANGGRKATERAIERSIHAAGCAIERLPKGEPRSFLEWAITMVGRST